jgi:hypothetical protein
MAKVRVEIVCFSSCDGMSKAGVELVSILSILALGLMISVYMGATIIH